MSKIVYNKKGAALVVTLAIAAILVAAALQLGKYAGKSALAALKRKDMFQAEQYALSGLNLARQLLCKDAANNMIDSIQEPWADSDILLQAVNEMGLDADKLTIKIIDELSKIQVNALIKEFPGNEQDFAQTRIWERFLQAQFLKGKYEAQHDPVLIINSVKDWLDSLDDDTITGISGAESDYYLALEQPYVCANAPFHHLDELLNVKGISKDFLSSDNIDNMEAPELTLAIQDIFTVYGLEPLKLDNGRYKYRGKININTASVYVIQALLPTGMEESAQELVDFRAQKSEDGNIFLNSLDKGWYKKVLDLSEKEQKQFENLICYSSNIFKVECTGVQNSYRVKLAAWIEREKQKESGQWVCRIIQIERE